MTGLEACARTKPGTWVWRFGRAAGTPWVPPGEAGGDGSRSDPRGSERLRSRREKPLLQGREATV